MASFDAAPIVAVGVIASDIPVGGSVPKHSDPSYPLQLRKMEIRIENVLKGDLALGTAVVYYFALAGGFNGNQPLGFWKVGGRRIFWLRRDSGVLRTACDGIDSCTRGVFSGAHPHYTADPRKSLAYAVADITLTRGEGKINEGKFAGMLQSGAPVPEEYQIEKFANLALTETSVVKTAACIQLWICAGDKPAPYASRKMALKALQRARCHCITKPDGSPDCGSTAHIDSDPPF